jgi:two-component system response regulator YesN
MELVGEASNGLEAFSLFQELEPDILITDIRMPGLDGLELIKRIRSTNTNIIILVLSSFENFEYARTAMKYGVQEYLLKSGMQAEELLTCLNDCIAKHGLRNNSEQVPLEQRKVEEPSSHGSHLPPDLHSNPINVSMLADPNLNEAKEICQKLSVRLSQPGYFFLISLPEPYEPSTKLRILKTIADMATIAQTLRDRSLQGVLGLFFAGGSEVLQKTLLDLEQKLSTYIEAKWFLYYSDLWCSAEEVFEEITQGLEHLHDGFVHGVNTSYTKPLVTTFGSGEKDQLRPQILALGGCIFAQDENLFLHHLRNLLYCFSKNRYSKPRLLEAWRFVAQGLDLFIDSIKRLYGTSALYHSGKTNSAVNLVTHSSIHSLDIHRNVSMSDCEEQILKYLEKFHIFNQNRQLSSITKQIIEVILTSHTTSISLDELSEKIQVTPNYLCGKFKKDLGLGLITYLNNLRITHAIMLLHDSPHLKIYAIAQAVGYPDSAYFSRIFKQVMGHTPREFLESINQ